LWFETDCVLLKEKKNLYSFGSGFENRDIPATITDGNTLKIICKQQVFLDISGTMSTGFLKKKKRTTTSVLGTKPLASYTKSNNKPTNRQWTYTLRIE
jgi:hypothetical protein